MWPALPAHQFCRSPALRRAFAFLLMRLMRSANIAGAPHHEMMIAVGTRAVASDLSRLVIKVN
jgi:hypothetical protein